MKKIEWAKNFGIKADVVTIFSLAQGQKYIKKLYNLPNCLDYKYINGEESRDKRYLDGLNKIVSNDPKKWVKKVVSKLDKICDKFEEFCRRKENYRELINSELLKSFDEFYKKYSFFLGVCDTPIFLEDSISEAILKDLEKKVVPDLDHQFKIATTYLGESYVIEEEKELLTIAVKHKNKKLFEREIERHWKKYRWTGFRITIGKEYDLKYFEKKAKRERRGASKRLKEIFKKQKGNKITYNRLAKKYSLDKKLLRCAQNLIWIRDKRFVGLTRGTFHKRDLFKEIAKRLRVETDEVLYLLPGEIKKFLLGGKSADIKVIAQRKKGFAILLLGGKLGKITTGERLATLKKGKIVKSKEVRGISANNGKVDGRIRVVIEDKDMKKFRKGEVLVTNMTSPDYIGIMRKAAAIITDLGGITCHAAIISRELNIPCIIGTKIATKVLKDGDLVEVDADKGIVKILKRK